MTSDDVRAILRREIEKTGTAKAWADLHGISPSYVSDVLGAQREPSDKIVGALNMEKAVTYHAKSEPFHSDYRTIFDMSVNENQRQALFELDRCHDDYALARWARRYGRPLMERVLRLGPPNKGRGK